MPHLVNLMPLPTILRSSNARKALAVVLVVVVVLTGLPLMVGMAQCVECDLGNGVCDLSCALLPFAAVSAIAAWALRHRPLQRRRIGFTWSLDPPPRFL